MTAKEQWEQVWPAWVHEDEYAAKRIQSALSGKLTPVKIDREDRYGYFQGSHGRYETFLDSCPCVDFVRTKRPCKHIYRLAMELGVMDGKFETNAAKVVTPKKEMMRLKDEVDLIESLSDDAQQLLLEIAAGCDSSEKVGKISIDIDMKKLDGIAFEVSRARKYKKVALAPNISARHVHLYLHRKLDSEIIFDVLSGDFVQVPLRELDLPDDAVTAQLRQRGYC